MAEDSGQQRPGKRDRAESHRKLVELWQQALREDLRHRKNWRTMFEEHERIFGGKVRQLRLERGWTQEQLAEKLGEHGWPMHQTTVAKLEAGSRPIRLAEADALALAFGLPIEALWYMPVTGEPWGLARMREHLKQMDDFEVHLKESLRLAIVSYADHQSKRMRLVQAMGEAAEAAERGELDLGLSEEKSREYIEALSHDLDRHEVADLMESRDPERAAEYRQRNDLLDRIESDEPQKVAAEAWRRYQAGESPEDIGRFLASSMPAGTREPLHAALEIVREALGPAKAAADPGRDQEG